MVKISLILLTTCLLFFLAFTQDSNLCSKGCLNCSSDGTCNLCNFFSNIYLTEEIAFNRYENPDTYRGTEGPDQCKFNFLENCLRTFPQGKCKECRKGYTLDRHTGNCQVEQNNLLVDHCIAYSETLCIRCGEGFLLRENRCVKSFVYREVETLDANGQVTSTQNTSLEEDMNLDPEKIFECEIYETNISSRCHKCTKGHYVTEEFKCRKYTRSHLFDPNCASISTFKCFQCDSGYALLNNAFLDRSFGDGTDHFPEIYRFLKNNIEGYFESLTNNSCIPRTVEGCLEYSGITTCKKCDNAGGYFLIEDKTCLKLTPEYIIPNCQEYLNKTKCAKCAKFFKLNSTNTQCEVVRYLENCQSHVRTGKLDLCEQCDEGYYSATPDTCLARSKDSERYQHCDEKHPYEDYCIKCTENYVFSVATFMCIEIPQFCTRYVPDNDPSAQAPFHKCVECQALHYLDPDTKACTPIPVANCRSYDKSQTKCTECVPTFYLETLESNEVVCSAHDIDLYPECKIFSGDTKNKCIYCGQNCNVFENKTQCVRRDQTDLCEWYDAKAETCVACFDGFELNASGDCRMLDSRNNCLRGAGNYCWKCKGGFDHIFSGTNLTESACLRNQNWVSKNCDVVSGKGKKAK